MFDGIRRLLPGMLKPLVNTNQGWRVLSANRVSACDNRPGLKKLYLTVTDEDGAPVPGVKVRFDVHATSGVAYDRMNVWGVTDENGRLVWDHLGVPTRYRLWMENGVVPLIENIRTDLGYEYCRGEFFPGWRPINRPGIYSYQFKIQRR